MSEQHDPFSPQRVDESVEDFLAHQRPGPRQLPEPGEHLVRDMRRLYGLKRQHYARSLQRVQDRLIAQHFPQDAPQTPPLETGEQRSTRLGSPQGSFAMYNERPPFYSENRDQWTTPTMQKYRSVFPSGQKKTAEKPASRWGRRANLLAAVLIILFLVSSMLVVLRVSRLTPFTVSPVATATPSATITPASDGWWQEVYTRPTSSTFAGLAWSPDGQRIASLDYNNGVKIWDATTGAHQLTIALTGGNPRIASFTLMAWSPNGKWLAIVNNSYEMNPVILIADTQTGIILHQFTELVQAEITPATQNPLLSDLLPASGGPSADGINGLVWSPDSSKLAFTIAATVATYKRFDILNAQTGALIHSFPNPANTWLTVASWSPDGKYLAVQVEDLKIKTANFMAWVWDTSTYQKVFQQNIGVGEEQLALWGDQLVWQPQSHNLAFAYKPPDFNSFGVPEIELWNVEQNKLVNRYTVPNSGILTFSPDGKYLATVQSIVKKIGPESYSTQESLVAIDPQSGKFIHSYQLSQQFAFLFWSPAGNYVALAPEETGSILILKSA